MPLYAMLSTLTNEGRRTLKSNPDRVLEVNKEVEAMGTKVVKQYAAIGACDFITIVEAADNEAIAKLSVELGSRGTIQIQTVPLIEVTHFISSLRN